MNYLHSLRGKRKVFGVSVKDRGAVSMAGHSGKAFWFSKSINEFVTSNYYYDEVSAMGGLTGTQKNYLKQYSGTAWELDASLSATYLFGDRDNQDWEFDLAGYGRTFPHNFS